MSGRNKLVLTGATGFVGSALVHCLASSAGWDLIVRVRHTKMHFPDNVIVSEASGGSAFEQGLPLSGVEAVIHAAARVHVMDDYSAVPLDEFRKVNVDGTINLARRAAAEGVKRFIFVSSIKVNGEATHSGKVYRADDVPAPKDPYGISKMEAEEGLRSIAAETDMEVVIIRPVLVYGPGVKANFRSMMHWLNKGIPLPLGAIHNKRSLVALDNIVDLIVTCIDHPAAANQTFLVSDGEDLSTTELLRKMGEALGTPARLIPVPERIISLGARLAGKEHIAQRLCGSLQVDMQKTCDLLGWRPPASVDEALQVTAQHYLQHKGI